jgi:hypothetical protein
MKSKDQQMLEEAYEKIVSEANDAAYEKFKREAYKKFVQDAKKVNPTWDPERPFTSGIAFKAFKPKGGWPDREHKKKPSKDTQKSKTVHKPKEKQKEHDLDVEGDPVGSYRSIAIPEPEIETKVVSIPFELLDNIQTKDSELYTIITGIAKKVEQNGDNLNFTYSADKAADIEFFIQNYK